MKYIRYILIVILCVFLTSCVQQNVKSTLQFGYLTGYSYQERELKHYYNTIVLNKSFKKSQLKKIHEDAKQIYVSLEVTKDTIKNSSSIKKFVKTCKKLLHKGYDGLFLEGFDIYSDDEKIYNGLLSILININTLKCPVILSDCFDFISHALSIDQLAGLIIGVHQSHVFTLFDSKKNKTYGQEENMSTRYKSFLNMLYKNDYKVYITEVSNDSDWKAVIKSYSKKYHYIYCYTKDPTFSKD